MIQYHYRSLLFVLAAINLQSADLEVLAEATPKVAAGFIKYADIGSESGIPCRACPLTDGSDCLGYDGAAADTVATQWYRDGLPLETTTGRFSIAADGNLFINPFKLGDVGDYYCKTTTGSGTLVSIATNLRASDYNFPIVFENTSLSVPRGDSIRLVCPSKSFVPTPTLTWYRNSQAITSLNQRFDILPEGILHITDLNSDTSGVYHCEARTINGSIISSQNNVTVAIDELGERKYKLLAAPPRMVRYMAGDDKVIELFINPADGALAQWYHQVFHDDGTSSWAELKSSKPNQYIRGLQVSGEYKAVISVSPDSMVTFTTNVEIGSPPVYDGSVEPITKLNGYNTGAAIMQCDLSGVPLPSITWYKNGEPVELCHQKRLTVTGSLTMEQLSLMDAGYYQCFASNEYGVKTQAYNLGVIIKDGSPYQPEITSARFIGSQRIQVYWRARSRPGDKLTLAFSVTYSYSTCRPDILTLYKVLLYDECQCEPCPEGDNECCQHVLEADDDSTDYKMQLSAFNRVGGQSSPFVIVRAFTEKPRLTFKYVDLGLQVLDFRNAVLIKWRPEELAGSYRVTLQYHNTDDEIPNVTSELIERTVYQNYTMIEGFGSNVSLLVELEAVQAPVTHKDYIQMPIWKSSLVTNKALAPTVQIMGIPGRDGVPGVIAYWTDVADCDYYYVWYKCDSREALVKLDGSKKTLRILEVEKRCVIAVAPVVNGKPQTAAVASYNKWCIELAVPENLAVTPHQREDVVYANDVYDVLVEWNAAHPNNETCEVNYIVQWKNAASGEYSKENSILVQDELHTIVKDLTLDVAYEFEVTAFTNVSDVKKMSQVVSHTVGLPPPAHNLSAWLNNFPNSTGVSWSSAASGHDVTMYVLRLYEKLGYKRWRILNITTVNVNGVKEHTVEYTSLNYSTTYNVTITGINVVGRGPNTAVIFSTPAITTATTTTTTTTTDNAVEPSTMVLTETQVGMIIGMCISVLLVFISGLMCFVFKKKFTKPHRRRRVGGRSSRLQCAYDQQPLTVSTVPPHYEMSTSVGEGNTCHLLVNNNVVPSLPLSQAFVSPPQLSLKATSGQDSGIDGTAEDHRSSQDLGEYDVETEALVDSSLSLNSELSAHCHTHNPRWSCELNDCPATVPLRAARTHRESESDSLLTDSHKHSQPTVSCKSHLVTTPNVYLSHPSEHSDYHGLDTHSSMDDLSSSCTLRASNGSTIGS